MAWEIDLRLDLSRPDWVFGVLWTLCFFGTLLAPESLRVEFNSTFAFLLVFNIASFFLVYRLFAVCYGPVRVARSQLVSDTAAKQLRGFIKGAFVLWLVLYLLTIVLSDGLPIMWIFTGDSRTYVDFGVPTLSGFLNMIRGFIFAGCVLLYLRRDKAKKKLYLLLLTVLLLSSLAEMARGNMLVLLLHGVAMWLIVTPIRFRGLFHAAWLMIVFILAFGLMGDIRNEGGSSVLGIVDEDSIFNLLPSGFLWAFLYFVTPAINVSYAIAEGIEPLYAPFFSVQSLLPTVIRDTAFDPGVYPIQLKVEAFNATSFYAPLLADYGVIGTALIVLLLQIVVAYLHVRAVRGSLFHLLVFPAFYMSVVLSVFYLYFFSLVTVLYPLMASAYALYCRNSGRQAKPGEHAPDVAARPD